MITDCISGDRKFKIPVIDPLFIPKLGIQSHGLEATIHNSTAVGLKDISLEKVG
jgi:hypothetical protein